MAKKKPQEHESVNMDEITELMGPLPQGGNEVAAATATSKKAGKGKGAIRPEDLPTKIELEPEDPTKESDKPEEEPVKEEESEPESEETEETTANEDPEVKADEVVDDIVATESEDVLEAEDEKIAKAFDPKTKRTMGEKIKGFFAAWWGNKKARYITLFIIADIIVGILVFPTSRYFVLNAVGVRAGASVVVLDQSTLQPLKGVAVTLGEASATTDSDGKVTFDHNLKLGKTDLKIDKRAFATVNNTVVLGWGSNPLGQTGLVPTGEQYTFNIRDFLSGKGIAAAEASTITDANASAANDGKIVLTLDKTQFNGDKVNVTIKAEGYRDEKLSFDANNKDPHTVKMVVSRPHVFVSKRNGKLDVYKVDIDGSNEKLLVAATGNERDDMTILTHPTEDTVALVSTRENVKNKDGYLLSTLFMVDLNTGELKKVTASEQIRIIGWSNSRLIYVMVAEGTSASNPKRNRLMSYETVSGNNKELDASNYFNDVMLVGNNIYYAPSNYFNDANNAYVFKMSPDGSSKQTILQKEGWNIFRTAYDQLYINSQQDWYTFKIGDSAAAKSSSAPSANRSRFYADSPTAAHSVWTEERDGKGVLLVYSKSTGDDQALVTKAGLQYPVYWLNDEVIVFRVSDGHEVADYAVNINGGDPVKIRDVTAVSSVDSYYY